MITDHDERAWWTFTLSDTATVHVPADTEAEAKRALRGQMLGKPREIEAWGKVVDGLVGRSRWCSRDVLKKEGLRT